jgi:phosphate transport system permease protein
MNRRTRSLASEYFFFTLFRMSAVLAVAILFGVLLLLFRSGHSVLSWQFLTSAWQHSDITKGGIFPAIVGSMWLGIGVLCISVPLGISTAIFLTEYSKSSLWQHTIQVAIRNLAGVPSVVYGLFGLAVFVYLFGLGMSLTSAILTLSMMTLPWVITASVEALETVPQKFRDSSFSLGATRWQTIWHIVLPAAIPGCITGGIIGMARALGETAPIILVGATFYLTHLPSSPFDKYMALPYHTFILATQHASAHAPAYAAGTAFVLMILTFVLSLAAILCRFHFRSQKTW